MAGTICFWSNAGVLLASQSLALGARSTLVLDTATVPGTSGTGGSITVSNDAPYGMLGGKAVALEPATGFSFDSLAVARAR